MLADSLSVARIVLVAPLSVLALTGHGRLVGLGLLFAGLTDVLDGRLARGYGGPTRRGALLDAVADTLLLVCAAAWIAILHPAVLRDGVPLFVTGAAYVAGIAVSLVTSRRIVDPHRVAPKIAGGFLYLFALFTLLAGVYQAALLRLALLAFVLASADTAIFALRQTIQASGSARRTLSQRPQALNDVVANATPSAISPRET
jgi:cardiolipin synthase